MQGISRMQLAAKAGNKYYKKVVFTQRVALYAPHFYG